MSSQKILALIAINILLTNLVGETVFASSQDPNVLTGLQQLQTLDGNFPGTSTDILHQKGSIGTVLGQIFYPYTDPKHGLIKPDYIDLSGIAGLGAGSVSGTGTPNFIPRFNAQHGIEDSIIYDNGAGTVGIGYSSPVFSPAKLIVNGQIQITDGTQGVGKVLISGATGLASWGDVGSVINETDPTVNRLGKTFALDSCMPGQIPSFSGATNSWVCTTSVISGETDPTVNALGKATLSCTAGQIAKFNGTIWACAPDAGMTAETDPIWTAASGSYYTKTNLQTAGQASIHFGNLLGTPTTLVGYGITDALSQGTVFSGDVTGNYNSLNIVAGVITNADINASAGIAPSKIATDSNNRFITDSERTTWNGKAPLLNPSFLGVPNAPTPIASDNSTTLATTAFVKAQNYLVTETDPIWTAASGSYYTKTNLQTSGQANVHFNNLTNTPTTLAGYGITDAQPLIALGTTSQYYRGDKTWQTLDKAAVGLPFVENTALSTWGGSANVTTIGTLASGTVPWARLSGVPTATTSTTGLLTSTDWNSFNGKAPLLNPSFLGVPNAPTPALGDSSTTLATTAFVKNQGYITNALETDPTVNALGKATLACSAGQIAKFNGTIWVCAPDAGMTAETDPIWTAASGSYYTKTNLQTSGQANVHWGNITNEPTTLGGYGITDGQPLIALGTTSQYYRGDKTWQTLDKTTIALGNVENTALSTWAGSANITTIGTLSSGTIPWARLSGIPTATNSTTGLLTSTDWTTFNGKAPLLSPAFIGTPTAPTVTLTDSSTSLATTAFVKGQGYLTTDTKWDGGATGLNVTTARTSLGMNSLATTTLSCSSGQVAQWNGSAWICANPGLSAESDPVWTAAKVNYATLASPALTGVPTAPTPVASDSSTALATTAFVKTQGYITGYTETDPVWTAAKANYATLASPALTGVPTAPTAAAATNTTQVATTAYVKSQGYLTGYTETDPTVNPLGKANLTPCSSGQIPIFSGAVWSCGNVSAAGALAVEIDPTVNTLGKATLACSTGQIAKYNGSAWVCSTDSTGVGVETDPVWTAAKANYATLASPALTGAPTAPTPVASDSSTALATTAFVKTQGYITGYTETDPVWTAAKANYATLASPALTGVPTAPTAGVGTNTTQVASTAFVQGEIGNAIAGLSWKNAVKVATTANITLSGLQSIDGYTTLANDRVLVKNQTTASANGIYIAAAGAWTRANDANTATEIDQMAVYVKEGTTQKSTGWVLANQGAITLDTTALTYSQFSGNGSYTAAAPVTLTGNQFSLGTVGTAGTYTKVTTDSYGRVTSGTTLIASDIPVLDWSKITTGKPTTLGGYGITDGQPLIALGTTSQYYRGDKTWQTLDKTTIALGNVENTALSTWAGSANITTIGTLTSGTVPWARLSGIPTATNSTTGLLTSTDWTTFNGKAPLLSPAFIGTPTAPTVTLTDSSTSLATTAFVKGQGYLTAEVDPEVGANTTNYLSKWNGTQLVTSKVYDDGTNVAIGNTSPRTALDVNGGIAAGRLGYFGTYSSAQVQGIWSIDTPYKVDTVGNTFGNQYGMAYAYNNVGGAINGFNHQIVFLDNGTMGASISLQGSAYFAGNMGLGTIKPTEKLQVSGGNILMDNNFALKQKAAGGTPWNLVSTRSDDSVLYSGYHGTSLMLGVDGGTYFYPGNVATAGMTLTPTGLGVGTTTPAEKLEVNGNLKVDGNLIVSGAMSTGDAPVFKTILYGANGDMPVRTTSTTPVTLGTVYAPLAYGTPACPSGTTKSFKLWTSFVDNISSGGQTVKLRIAFTDAVNQDFDMGNTWGGSPAYRTYLSPAFTSTDGNHANIQLWVNGTAGPYVELRNAELWMYCK